MGYTLFFLFLLKNIDCVYPLEPPNEYPQSMFEQKYENYQNFLSEIFHFLVVKFSDLNRHVFVTLFHFLHLAY